MDDTPPKLLIFTLFCFSLLSLHSGSIGVHGEKNQQQQQQQHHHHHHAHRHLFSFKPSKLFVFGDSYADTGNIPKSLSNSWKLPYGITFPGKPAGRFSDGRVSTDYLAKFIGVKSPIPYRWMKFAANRIEYGMNYAYGGTGVMDTLVPLPNMTTQIDLFQQTINQKVYSPAHIQCSVALVSVAGNDYSAYLARNGTTQVSN
ncbi:hypothetical protein Tsubulata_004111 [Turnera subulata]|uniref:GDSL esterase/lipase n=1 Tax=Turnera subulata TaxID=218843 RepID=A0A9Q0FNT3_9ROSI|nr:hypothetical protein Tsubulata_004111 [Turnera subulata]